MTLVSVLLSWLLIVSAYSVWRRRRAYKRVEPAPGADEVMEVGARRKEPMTSVRPMSNGGS